LAIVLFVLLLFILLDIVLFVLLLFLFWSSQWPKEKNNKRTNNAMAKRKITKGQTTQRPKENKTKGQTTQWPKEKITKGQTTQCCLSFCYFSFGHCVVCRFVIFLLAIVLFVLLF
jgi:Flp pilus assembly protein TadB